MAHYAFLDDNNIVVDLIVGRDEDEIVDGISDWEEYYSQVRGMKCLRTSYNSYDGVYYDPETGLPSEDQSKVFRGSYATIGGTYDQELDVFLPAPEESI